MTVLSIGQMWGADYELMLTLDVTKGAPTGSTSTGLSDATLLSYLQGAAPATTDITSASLTGNVYKGKGSGGAGIPQACLKVGKASGAGSITFAIANTYDDVTKVEITGYGWKTSTAVSVNSSDAQSPATALSEVTFSYEISGSKSITINSASSAFCATEIKLYKTKSGGTPTPSLSVAPTSIDFGTVEQGASVSSEAVAVTFANLTGGVTYSGLSGAFSATGNIVSTGDEITISANTSNVGEYEQTLTVTSAADSKSATVTVTMNVVEPFDGLQLTFPDDGSEGSNVSSYTTSWSATKGTQSWSIYGFNTNKWGWNPAVIKTGRKNNSGTAQPLTATIVTQVTDHAVGDIVVTVDAVTAAQITSHKLYVADNSSFDDAIEIDGDPTTIAVGNITYTVPVANRANDLYYKLEYATAGTAGSNGILTISKITYAYATAAPQKESTGLAYAVANHLVKVGASYEAPTLTNPNNLTGIAYASSDANIVAVDASTGALTIKAAGKAVITASREADDTYKAGSASYTVYVATEAGTAEDPLSESSAKALIDLGCTMNAHVAGVVSAQDGTYYTVTLSNGFKFWSVKDIGNVDFESAYLVAGDQVTAYGQLLKYNSTYELATGCYLTSYTHPTSKTHIVSDIDNPITVAAAIGYIDEPETYDLTDDVWVRGVVTNIGQTSGASPVPYIDVKDANENNSFRFFNYTVNSSISEEPQQYDILIATGKLDKHNAIYELNGCEVVSLVRPDVAVSSVELDQNAASIEVNETVTLHATVLPDNASNKSITWSVQSGSEFASVADGVVTGVKAGEAVIRAASAADNTKYAECTVTVTAADPTKHVVTFDATVDTGESPLSKSNITLTSSNGVLNNGSEYRLYKSSTTTFACSTGNITKIEFTGVSGNPVSGFGDPEVGTLVTEGNDGVWTGNAASVSFVASGAQVRATEIKVTYKEDNRSAAGLEWSAEAVVLTVGNAFTAPTLTNPNNIAAGEITIASGNTELAVVNEGVVSLVENATGEATITATFNGNDNYKPATVSYTITVNEAGLDNITFDATQDVAGTNELSITKSGFTLAFTDGVMGNSSEYRLYKNQTMTLSSADYKIKKIEFTCTSGNPITGFADAEGLDKENNQWTGETNSVELTASNAQVRITKLKVSYIEDPRAAAGIAYETTEYGATINGAFTTPTLTNSHNLTVTYSSSDQNLAQVDENSGEVTIGAAEGTVTITATFAGNDTYKPGTASYTINIIDPTPVILVSSENVNFGTVNQNAEIAAKTINVTLKNVASAIVTLAGEGAGVFSIDPESLIESGTITVSVTNTAVEGTYEATVTISDASQEENAAEPKVVNISMTVQNKTNRRWYVAYQPKVGMQVIIASAANNSGDLKAMGAQNTNNRAAVANSVVEGILEPAEGTETFTLVSAGYDEDDNQLYAIMTSEGGYLYAASSSANQLKTQTTLSNNGKWKITISSAGIATIKAQGSSSRNWMQYNSGSSLFACYAGAQQDIYLYTNHKQQSPSSTEPQSIADITGSDAEEASATKVYVPAGKTLAVATTDPAIPELVVEAKKNVSTQIKNPERITTPDFYLDYQLCDGALDADYWYCIAVPFNVDINMGIYKTDGTKLTNHVDYEVWGYDTEKRAETMSNGWTRLNGGMMQAGHAYLIGFNDGMDNMVRLKAAADWKANLYNKNYLELTAASNGADALGKHSNWNALGNPTTQYKSLNSENVSNVQMFDNNAHTFSTFDLATSNFVMGRPFFIQYGSNIDIVDEKAGGEFRAPKRQSEKFYYEVQIARVGKKNFDNQIIVRASEDATNTYEQGHDVITMNDATSKKAALLWTKNYGDMRLAAEEAPFADDRASYELGIYAPANGTYSISVAEAKDNADLYLTYNGSIIWNLSMSEYTNDFEKGNNQGYGLLLVKKAPQVITGVDNVEANEAGVQKVIINNHVYILRAEQMYDVTGKMVK